MSQKEQSAFIGEAATYPAHVTLDYIRVNFQPQESDTPTDYLADMGQSYGLQGNGETYGWRKVSNNDPVENRPAVEMDSRYRTFNAFQKRNDPDPDEYYLWEIALAAGDYDVTVVTGDPDDDTGLSYKIRASGDGVDAVDLIDGTVTTFNPWLENTETVTVTAGHGALWLYSGNWSLDNTICYIELVPDGAPEDAIRVNFEPIGYATPDGYLSDTGLAYGDRGDYDYGWRRIEGSLPAVDNFQGIARVRTEAASLNLRTLNQMQRPDGLGGMDHYQWEIALTNGNYYVYVKAGDPYVYENRSYEITANGVTPAILEGTTSKEQPFVSGGATVNVTNGKLTLASGDTNLENTLCYVIIVEVPVGGDEEPAYDLPLAYDPLDAGVLMEDSHFEYEWDDLYRLTRATDKTWEAGAAIPEYVTYLYDALGRRVARNYSDQANGWENIITIYDGVVPIEERYTSGDNDDEIKRRFYYEDGINKVALVEIYDGQTTPQHSYVPLTDDRGTVVGVVDVTNPTTPAIVEKLYYNSTGLCKSFDGSGNEKTVTVGTHTFNIGRSEFIPFGWCGVVRDEFTGKYHTHFREYDPIHGRWLSEDPAGYRDGLSLYAAYMGVNDIDPWGLASRKEVLQYAGRARCKWKGSVIPAINQLAMMAASDKYTDEDLDRQVDRIEAAYNLFYSNVTDFHEKMLEHWDGEWWLSSKQMRLTDIRFRLNRLEVPGIYPSRENYWARIRSGSTISRRLSDDIKFNEKVYIGCRVTETGCAIASTALGGGALIAGGREVLKREGGKALFKWSMKQGVFLAAGYGVSTGIDKLSDSLNLSQETRVGLAMLQVVLLHRAKTKAKQINAANKTDRNNLKLSQSGFGHRLC